MTFTKQDDDGHWLETQLRRNQRRVSNQGACPHPDGTCRGYRRAVGSQQGTMKPGEQQPQRALRALPEGAEAEAGEGSTVTGLRPLLEDKEFRRGNHCPAQSLSGRMLGQPAS